MHPSSTTATEPLLELRDVTVHYREPVRRAFRSRAPLSAHVRESAAVRDISLSIHPGQSLGVVGESGSGKSTIASVIMGLVRPLRGEVIFEGESLVGRRSRSVVKRIQMVYQDPNSSLNPRMTVRQTLGELLAAHTSHPRAVRDQRLLELLDQVGLPQIALDRYPRSLSGGQRQRVGIARALATTPDLLVLDEAVSALDVSVQAGILHLVRQLRAELGLTVVFISHDLGVIRNVCDDVVVMRRGDVVEAGAVEATFSAPAHEYTRALLASVPAFPSVSG